MKFWKSFAAVLSLLMTFAPVETRATPKQDVAYIIPIRGMIEPALLYVIRRGVAEAEREDAKAIIFVMDTPGGTLDAASDIVHTIQQLKVPTYTFVENHAFSAGAIIAMATDHIYMAPGTVIGDAMPIMISPLGGAPQDMPESLQEKSVSAVSALIRSAAQMKGHDPQLAEKMVRREIEYRIGDELISPTNQLLTLTNVEAERKVGPEKRRLLSEGTVKDVNELLGVIGLASAQAKELEVTSAERIARYISALAPLLLMAGLLGLYIEIKTPGVALPGVLGVLALALFFWGHHIAGLAGMEEVVIFLVGVGLLLLEVFVFPGVGILGLAGGLMMMWALLSAMAEKFPGGPWYPTLPQMQVPLLKLSSSFVLAAIAAGIIAKFLPKTTVFNKLVLDHSTSRQAGYASAIDSRNLIGLEGVATSQLRPAGSAIFGDKPLDVVTRGEFLQNGTRVRIVECEGSRIVVEALASGAGSGRA